MNITNVRWASYGVKGLAFVTAVLALGSRAAGAPQISVAWGLPGTPTAGDDFIIDPSDPLFPDIELVTGNTTWWVWSRDDVTGAVSDIGDVTAFGFANYTLVLTDQAGVPGGRTAKSIVLTPGGSNRSSVIAFDGSTPSRLTGDLLGDLTVVGNAPLGGHALMTIDGTLSGDFTAPGLVSLVFGTVAPGASVTVGQILQSFLTVNGDVDGPITVSQGMPASGPNPSTLTIHGDLGADLTVGFFENDAHIHIGGDCGGTIQLNLGLPPATAFEATSSLGAPPTVHVTWDESPAPVGPTACTGVSKCAGVLSGG